MEQQKIGAFLKNLRKEKNITQAQFAENVGVSNRSVSRWETGRNMPDLDILIQIADYYDVKLGEILDGERKKEPMDKKMEETVLKVADYSHNDKMNFTRRVHYLFITGVVACIVFIFLDFNNFKELPVYDSIAGFSLGMVFAVLILGVLFTRSKSMVKIRAFKMRLLKRNKDQ